MLPSPIGFRAIGRWREAINLVETMRSDGLSPDEYTYAGCIDACAKALQWKKACQLLDEMRAAGVQVETPGTHQYVPFVVDVPNLPPDRRCRVVQPLLARASARLRDL